MRPRELAVGWLERCSLRGLKQDLRPHLQTGLFYSSSPVVTSLTDYFLMLQGRHILLPGRL